MIMAEMLPETIIEAGLEWIASGCSMCVGMNGDAVPSSVAPPPPIGISAGARGREAGPT
jgi:hypothetical protein